MVDVTFRLGNEKDIMVSIKDKLLNFPENTVFYPGHGESGILSEEKCIYFE